MLLFDIERGLSPKEIASHLKTSKQALNYHLRQLEAKSVIYREQSYPFAIYRLSPKTRALLAASKKNPHTIGGGDTTLYKDIHNLWRIHNIIVGFRIEDYGTFNFQGAEKIVKMCNWKYAREDFNDFVVNIQDTGLLKIYLPPRYGQEPEVVIHNLLKQAEEIANIYARKYHMVLSPMESIRGAHKELCNSEVLGKLIGKHDIDGVYADASTGTMCIEERQQSNKIEKLLKLPETMEKWANINEQLARNIELHLSVMVDIRDAIKELRETIRK